MTKTIRISKLAAVALAVSALTRGVAGRAMAAPGAPAAGAVDDAQIARRVLDLNRAEEETSDAVKGKLVSPSVWQLAQRMSVDHAALDQEFEGLAAADRQSDGSGMADARPERPILSRLSGDDLEQAYVDREVKSHEAMLAALDRDLIPGARSEELQRRLIDVRAEIAAHLQPAKNVQHAEWVRQTLEQQRADIAKEIGNSGP